MNDYINEDVSNRIRLDNIFLNNEVVKVSTSEYNSLFRPDVSDDVKLEIFQKIISNILLEDFYSKQQASDFFKYLLNRDGSYSESEVMFISYYVLYLNYCRIKYDERALPRAGFENIELPKLVFATASELPDFDNKKTLAAYSYVDNTVYVNLDSKALAFMDNGDKDKLFAYLQYLSHEMVHYRQAAEADSGMLSVSAFNHILSFIIRNQQFDSDDENYRFRDWEVEAQIESMKYAVELGREYFPQYIEFQERMLRRREDYMLEEALSMQNDDTNFSVLRDFYDIAALNVVMASEDRNTLNFLFRKFPQLNIFYDKSGCMRSEESLLQGYSTAMKIDASVASIYEKFLVYLYNWSESANNANLPDDLLREKVNFISAQVEKELFYLSVIEKIVDDHKEKIGGRGRVWEKFHTKRTVRMRKRRLQLYYEFLSSVTIGQDSKVLSDIEAMINSYDIIISKFDNFTMINKMLDSDIYNGLAKDLDNIDNIINK